MKKLLLVAVACAAMATPSLASTRVNVNILLSNHSTVLQGGGNGSADVALVAQAPTPSSRRRRPPDRRHQQRVRRRADRQLVLLDLLAPN